MSIRTIIEINHDYLHDLVEDPRIMKSILTALKGTFITGMLNAADDGEGVEQIYGVRVLAQRHHSDEITLKIK